jgi:hypothetical protein
MSAPEDSLNHHFNSSSTEGKCFSPNMPNAKMLKINWISTEPWCYWYEDKGYIGELSNLTTKIITLLEFFNFDSEVSRLQYEWSSDCWCIWKSFGVNACLQWRKYFHFIGEVFCTVFLRICWGYFDCTCTCWAVKRNGHVCNKYLTLPPTHDYRPRWARTLQN